MSGSSKRERSALRAPEPIKANHDLNAFASGEPSLDDWLRRRALRNEARGASRTYVVCEQGSERVVAYYCLAAGAVAQSAAPGRVKRNMPDPVPVMVLGRLAVDQRWQGRRVGPGLLRDAILRTLQAAEVVGMRAILVHAISHRARSFYERYGFRRSSLDDMRLLITLADAKRALKDA